MKWIVSMWLIATGIGVAYSVVLERKGKIRFMAEMEHSLEKLAYYMYRWRMPIKEAVYHMTQEEKGDFQKFYIKLLEALEERHAEDFGKLWQEHSKRLLERDRNGGSFCGKEGGEQEVQAIWTEAFVSLPIEAEALHKGLLFRVECIKEHREELEKKYKGEQKLVFAMGIFVSTFFCLIFW